jgi:ELWxxDGT repeat protein
MESLIQIPGQFVPFQNKLFFLSYSGLLNFKLYSTDGNSATVVKDFGVASFAFLAFAVVIDNKLLFSAQTGTNGWELWSSDGTSAQVFKDINPGAASSNAIILPDLFGAAYNFTDFHTRLYKGNQICFIADDGTHGSELWITDGTSANTKMVKDINPGSGSSMDPLDPLAFIYTTTDFYFGANNGSVGYELWKTDGTSGNTSLVKDIWSGAASSDPDIFLFVNSHVYVTADDGDNGSGKTDVYKVDAVLSLLPLNLLNFTAAYNGKTVDLNWSTATETNTKNFVIQRSYDAAHFDNIGTVAAAGNSDRQVDYHYTDGSALSGGSKIYYRLQMVDNDGKFSYSKVALVTLLPNGSMIVVYPNPVKDQLYIVSNASVTKADVRITDQSGKVVYQKQFENIQAGVINKINVAPLAKGVYYLQFNSETGKQSITFVKQ